MSRKSNLARPGGTGVVWPRGIEARYGISAPTRWRWERQGLLPARDVFVAGKAVGWKPTTLDAADAGIASSVTLKEARTR